VICPTCGAEYISGFTRCSDCLLDLVEPPRPGPKPKVAAEPPGPVPLTDAVCVYRATQRGRLPIAQSLLRSADIPFTVIGEYVPQLTGLDAYGPAELYVSAADAEDARDLLADLDR